MTELTFKDRVLGGLWGAVVGDALGVPVEFRSRAEVRRHPVTNLRGHGTYNQPKGTWSDDSSLMLCTVDSLVQHEFDTADMGQRFVQWSQGKLWTPWGRVFDIGGATSRALERIHQGVPAEQAGGIDKNSNGNGSLMRILPIALRFRHEPAERLLEFAYRASALTHKHPRSQMVCGFYCLVAAELLRGQSPEAAHQSAAQTVGPLFKAKPLAGERHYFAAALAPNLATLPEKEIASGGHVVDTLTASLWCLLTSKDYEETVLKAVNLGEDTDTTGIAAGGLAGVYYGFLSVPEQWRSAMARAEDLEIKLFCRLEYGEKSNHDDWPVMFESLFAQSGLSLERLKTFREIVAAGGITAAAGDDSNRQSQFSRQLKELERYFGVELLKRGRGPVALTDAGQRLYEIVGHTLRALEELRGTCAGQPVDLVVGAGESVIQWLLLPRLPGLAQAHPRLTVTFQNLKTEDILRQVLDGGIDFGVVSRYAPHRALMGTPLGKLDFCLFAPSNLLPANPKIKIMPEILGELPLAMLDGSARIRQAIEQEAQRVGVKLNVRLRFSSYPQLAQAVQNLHVAAVMPKLAAASFNGTEIRAVHLPFLTELSRQVSLVWNSKAAEVRPPIAQYARLLPAIFRMDRT